MIFIESILNLWILLLLFIGVVKYILLFCGYFVRASTSYPSVSDLRGQTSLPLYTILVPLFMEKCVDVLRLRKNIFKTEYSNFEVIYLCEDVDVLLLSFLKSEAVLPNERVMCIPKIPPFTKPKACNYGLEVARGEYVVIYDAEDDPHSLQLLAAHCILSTTNYMCVQFPLEFVTDGTILSVWQFIDYLVWYKRLLPVCLRLNVPIPLGGTSNHFKVSELRKIGGWNAFNVTEDAELGLRIYSVQKSVAFVPMYKTKERTVKNILNLSNQRTRWVKGHFLTFLHFFLVNMMRGDLMGCLWVFFMLASYVFVCISYFGILLFVPNQLKGTSMTLMTFSVCLFFVLPLLYIVAFKELRCKKYIVGVLFYPVYSIFYIIPVVKALLECVFFPSFWYKTTR